MIVELSCLLITGLATKWPVIAFWVHLVQAINIFWWTKMLTKVLQRNLTRWGHVKTPLKPHPNLPWGKPRFRVKSKMADIKPVISVFFLINRYNLRTKQRTATYNMSSRTNFLNEFYLLTFKIPKSSNWGHFQGQGQIKPKNVNNLYIFFIKSLSFQN